MASSMMEIITRHDRRDSTCGKCTWAAVNSVVALDVSGGISCAVLGVKR